jgi:Na+/melibiose symporter-like transporter
VSLWRNRNFTTFWVSQTLSVAGDAFSLVAVPLLVLEATGSVARMGLLTGVSGVAAIVSGFFAGAIVDRFDRRRLLIVADVARLILYGLIPLAWVFGPQLWVVYATVPLAAAFSMIFQVAYVTAVRNLVEREEITEANGRLFASQAAAGIGGTIAAGLISGAFGPVAAIGVDAATFAVSALGLMLVRLRPSEKAPERAAEERMHPWRDFAIGFRFLWRHPVLRALTVLLCFFLFFYVGFTDILIFYTKQVLGQPDRTVGLIMAMSALGAVAGSLAVAPLRRRLGFGVSWIGSTILAGGAVALVGFTASVPVVAGLAMATIFFTSIGGINSMSLRQQVTPDHLLGRVTSTFWTIQRALTPAGATVLTAATGRFGVTQVCLASGIVLAAVGLAGAFTPIRQSRPEDARPEDARPEDARPEDARPEDARPEDALPGKAGPEQLGMDAA